MATLRNAAGRAYPWCRTIVLRDARVEHRQCSSLELLVDVGFLVAVSAIVTGLRKIVVAGGAGYGALTFLALFVPVCWAWMQFTSFSSAYDNDDVLQRVCALAHISGLIVLTATVTMAFKGDIRPFAAVYALMRTPLMADWWRAAIRSTGPGRRYAQRNAVAIGVCLLAWLAVAACGAPGGPPTCLVLTAGELAVTTWAVKGMTTRVFHTRHLTERFGGFSMIVLGEIIVAAGVAMRKAAANEEAGPVVAVGVCVLLSGFAVWWLYSGGQDNVSPDPRWTTSLRWSEGQLPVFTAVAAMGAGGEVAVDVQADGLPFSLPMQIAVVAPAAVALLALAWVHHGGRGGRVRTIVRVLAAPALLAVGLRAATYGPVAAVTGVGAMLLLTVAVEIFADGVRQRSTPSDVADFGLAGPAAA